MKPPPRQRAPVNRTRGLDLLSRDSVSRWQQPEKRKLLKGLKTLSKGDPDLDLDLAFLKTCVVTRSIPEIRSMVESLKDKVISGAMVELHKWRSEKKLRKPIEIWTDMASSVAGSLEEHVSAAFSQVLMVSSTEPRTLQNCDPPRVRRATADRLVGRAVPLRPVLIVPVQAQPVNSSASPVNHQLSKTSPAPLPSPTETREGLHSYPSPCTPLEYMAMNQSANSSTVWPPLDHCQTGATPPASSQPSSHSLDIASPPTASTTSVPGVLQSAVTGNSRLSSSAAAVQASSKDARKDSPRTLGAKCLVDFEKIYRYLSAIHKPDAKCNLTPMESAIMVDLLMSLPEEFQHLDCTKLHKHLVQVYKCLSSPASSSNAKEMLEKLKSAFAGQTEAQSSRAGDNAGARQNGASSADAGDAAAGGGQKPQPNESSPNQNTPNQSSSTDVTEFSPPPLNPFMIPSYMLIRK